MRLLLLLPALFAFTAMFAQRSSDNPYDESSYSFDGLSRVKLNGLYGYINDSKKEIIEIKYKKAEHFWEGLVRVSRDGMKWGVIDKKGKTVVDFKYDKIDAFVNDMAIVKKDEYSGVINKSGKEIIPIKYAAIGRMQYDLFAIKEKGKYGLVSKNGSIVLPAEYDEMDGAFSEGYLAVAKNGKVGFINTSGKIVIPLQWDGAKRLSEGRIAVFKGDKWGYIDEKGKEVVDFRYYAAESYKGGEAKMALTSGNYFFIDRAGSRLVDGRWIYNFTKNDLWGKQYWGLSKTFPSDQITKKWKEDFYISALEYDPKEQQYLLIMSKSDYYANQLYRKRSDLDAILTIVKGFFAEGSKEKDYFVTNIFKLGGDWVLVASKPKNNVFGTKQRFAFKSPSYLNRNPSFPKSEIEEARKNGHFLYDISGSGGYWPYILTNPPYYEKQVVESYAAFPEAEMKRKIKSGNYVTNIAYDTEWNVVYTDMTKKGKFSDQEIVVSNDLSTKLIQEYWDRGFSLRSVQYIKRGGN